MSPPLDPIANAVARLPALRRLGSAVTSRLKRRSTDVAIAGFPKCGNTWYALMLREVLVVRFGLARAKLDRLFVSDLGPLPFAFRVPRGIPRLYHNHFMPFPERPDLAGMRESVAPFADKPMIVLVRGAKDALVSYYIMEVRRFRRMEAPQEAEAFLGDAAYGVPKFVSYYNLVAEMRRASAAPTLVTRYEDLLADPAAVLERDAAFIGAGGLPRDALATIAAKYSFENMRRMELAATEATALVPGLHRVEGATPDASFVRSGRSGTWRDHLSAATAGQIDRYVEAHLDALFRDAAIGEPAVAAAAG